VTVGRLGSLWRNLGHRRRVDTELDDELQATLELLIDEKVRGGMRADEARRAARVELGSIESVKDGVREVRAGAGLDVLLQDVRYALRLFRRGPGFTALAIVTLALGIGANVAIFGVVKSVLLDSLPYADADRLLRVYAHASDDTRGGSLLTARMVATIAARQQSFQSLAAFDSPRDAVYGSDDAPQIVTIAWIEPQLFETLGVSAAIGRTFHPDDRAKGHVPASGAEVGPDTARAVVVAHAAWRRLFAGDPEVVGREVRINGIPRTVIGVLPRHFVGPRGPADFFLAFELAPALTSGAGWLGLVGRLMPGTTPETAQREVAALWASREFPNDYSGLGMSVTPLRDSMVGSVRTPLLVLMASAALVLLVACANLAGALLSRSLSRRKELAVRLALGAGRRRLVRQLLTESTVLALAGGVAGLLLAQAMLSLLRGLATPVLPAYARLSLDAEAILATAVVAVCTGLAFGVAPALAITRANAGAALHDDARGASEGLRPRRLRGLLVAGQLALCASLLAGAGLLSRSLWEMATAPVGFDAHGVLSARVRLSTRGYPTLEARARFHEQLADRLRLLPGVDAVALANKTPAVEPPRRDSFTVEGAPPADARPLVAYASVSDGYFRALRIPVRDGRTFDASDRDGSPPTAVLSETLARRHWPGGGAVGARVRLGGDLVTVVGVVGDVRNDLTRPDAEPMAYRSQRQESTQRLSILLRTRSDTPALSRLLQREVSALDPSLPVQQAMPLDAALGEGLVSRRLPVLLITAFSAMALLLASVGVYGMFASMAAAREREFGVRMALGSPPRAIAGLMLRQGGAWMAAGLSGGVIGTALVVTLLRGWLYRVPPFDPLALGGALAILLACAAIALLIPVHRATRVDPLIALRAE
jgi:putative ABC transport system permease protein